MSLWEYAALVTGWSQAHDPAGADADVPAMSPERFDELWSEATDGNRR